MRGDAVTLTAPRTALDTPSVFVSYRHEDTARWAAHVGGLLRVDLGIDNVFVDPEELQQGEELPRDLEGRICRSDVTLVLIGDCWDGGDDQLADDDDWVRREIRMALAAKHDVVPVVFGGARLPRWLPDDIALIGDLPRINFDTTQFDLGYQSILTAVWHHIEHRPDRLLVVSDDSDRVEQAIASFVSASAEVDWATPRTCPSAATVGLQVLDVERYADQWPDILALDRDRGDGVLEARLRGLAHQENILRIDGR